MQRSPCQGVTSLGQAPGFFLSLFCNTNRLPALCCGDAGGSCISLCSSLQAHMWCRQYPVFPQQHCTAPWRRGHHRRITMSQLLRCDIPAAGGGRLYRHHRQRAKPADSRTAGNPGVATQVASAQILRRFQPAFHEEGNDSHCVRAWDAVYKLIIMGGGG